MPLSDADNARLYSDAFQTNAKTLFGENGFVIADLKTQLDVARMGVGVLEDELAAAQKDVETIKAERDTLAAKWAGSTEGKDEALQAEADRAARV